MSKNWLSVQDGTTHKVKKGYYVIDGTTHKVKKGYTVQPNFERRNLPGSYTQVEYIESNGTQYFNTGYVPKYNSRVVMDVSDIGASGILFGTRSSNSATDSEAFLMLRNATSIRSDYFGSNATLTISDTSKRTIIDKSANIVTLFGSTLTNTAVSSGECSYPLYLFAGNNLGSMLLPIACRLYSCQIYDNGTLVRDYVPCFDANGAAGLYEMVEGYFDWGLGSDYCTAGPEYSRVTRLFYSGGMEITYTGAHTISDVTKDGVAYKLYTLTKSGTLTIDGDGTVQYWMCGGGENGGSDTYGSYRGGGGAFAASGSMTAGTRTVTIGARQGNTSISGVKTAKGVSGVSYGSHYDPALCGTGGGARANEDSPVWEYGRGDGVSKYPFGLSSLYAHCAGGGGGAYFTLDGYKVQNGGAGGTNGGNGKSAGSIATGKTSATGGAGGTRGGGKGGNATSSSGSSGSNATFYGSGGGSYGVSVLSGGNSYGSGGSGYQGVVYLLVPADLLAG